MTDSVLEETLGPDGEAVCYLNVQTGTFHREMDCHGGGHEPVRVGECLFDEGCSACRHCYGPAESIGVEYECPECGEVFDSRPARDAHLGNVHDDHKESLKATDPDEVGGPFPPEGGDAA